MGGVLQGAFPLGFALASLAYGLLFDAIGWRGLLWLGILPAILCVFIRYYVKEPDIWVENRKRQREQKQEVRAPLLVIFTPALLRNTVTACWWTGNSIVYYSIYGLFAAWLQTDFKLAAAVIATPVLLSNLASFFGNIQWGMVADRIGRRGAMVIAAVIACIIAPAYLTANDLTWIMTGFIIQGAFGRCLPALSPCYLSERFPTEVRSTASGFCYHIGTVFGGLAPPIISYLAVQQRLGYATPMLIGTIFGAGCVILALLVGPETKGKVLVPELMKL
jgi:SHS family lactate transporter-like MFS transporter